MLRNLSCQLSTQKKFTMCHPYHNDLTGYYKDSPLKLNETFIFYEKKNVIQRQFLSSYAKWGKPTFFPKKKKLIRGKIDT